MSYVSVKISLCAPPSHVQSISLMKNVTAIEIDAIEVEFRGSEHGSNQRPSMSLKLHICV